jgi:cell division protein ZapA (FtsZ GTPase activity inhibitor)
MHSKCRTQKISIVIFAVIGFMAGILITGCEKSLEQKVKNTNEGVRDAKQELKDAQTEFFAEWRTFKSESEQKIKANEKIIDAFKENMEKAGSKVKAKYSNEVAELEQKNRDLKKKLEDHRRVHNEIQA